MIKNKPYPSDESTTRIYSLDFLRLIAATMIVVHHYQAVYGVNYGKSSFSCRFDYGMIVEFFFVLSGYLTKPVDHAEGIKQDEIRGFLRYYIPKILRLLPMMSLSVVVYELIILFIMITGIDIPVIPELDFFGTIITIMGISSIGLFRQPIINLPVWYIGILLLCYIVLYVITRLLKSKKNRCLAFLGLSLFGFFLRYRHLELPLLNAAVGRGYSAFFVGALLRSVNGCRPGVNDPMRDTIAELLLCVLGIWLCGGTDIPGKAFVLIAVVYPCLICLFQTRFIRGFFRHVIWEEIGRATYDVYIWHMPLLILLMTIIRISAVDISVIVSSPWGCIAVLGYIYGVAGVIYCLGEKPLTGFLLDKWYSMC